jgi:CxxC motif-containing protein (DUF1111 family)
MVRSAIVVFSVCLVTTGILAERPEPTFGDPLEGLTKDQLADFEEGQEEFNEIDDVAEGLGPVFNEPSCATCHVGPNGAIGGTNDRLETRFGSTASDGTFDPMIAEGGSLLQDHGIGNVGGYSFGPEVVPPAATVIARRRTTALFGLGLVDAVPDGTFVQLAALQARFLPGTAGRVSVVTDPTTGMPAVGKFGWKAQVPTLLVFSGDAYLNEMGITNPIFPNENCPQGDCAALVHNPVPGLNDDGTATQAFANFMQFLAPPPRAGNMMSSDIVDGRRVFLGIGCANCHLPTLVTGRNTVKPLDRVTFHPFSDFLLHDMGSLGDGITQNLATGNLMRTQPLWGLNAAGLLLHDGRAATIEAAIQAHDGQGAAARDAFVALSSTRRAQLLAFLRSL